MRNPWKLRHESSERAIGHDGNQVGTVWAPTVGESRGSEGSPPWSAIHLRQKSFQGSTCTAGRGLWGMTCCWRQKGGQMAHRPGREHGSLHSLAPELHWTPATHTLSRKDTDTSGRNHTHFTLGAPPSQCWCHSSSHPTRMICFPLKWLLLFVAKGLHGDRNTFLSWRCLPLHQGLDWTRIARGFRCLGQQRK